MLIWPACVQGSGRLERGGGRKNQNHQEATCASGMTTCHHGGAGRPCEPSGASTPPPSLAGDIFNLIKLCQHYWFWHFQLRAEPFTGLAVPWIYWSVMRGRARRRYQHAATWMRSLSVFLMALRCLPQTLTYGRRLRPTRLPLPIINPSLDSSLLFNLCRS